MSALVVVRHASAGDRSAWVGDDAHRPLDKRGHAEAAWLVELLADRDIGRILSSPAVRCTQTVEPLAAAIGLPLDVDERLAEGRGSAVHMLVGSLDTSGDVVLCSHGDVIGELVGYDRPCRKGSVWIMLPAAGGWEPSEYIRPPKSL